MRIEYVQTIPGLLVRAIDDVEVSYPVALFYGRPSEVCELKDVGPCAADDLLWGVPDDPNAPVLCSNHFFKPELAGSEFIASPNALATT